MYEESTQDPRLKRALLYQLSYELTSISKSVDMNDLPQHLDPGQ